jgi:hypothetical protein
MQTMRATGYRFSAVDIVHLVLKVMAEHAAGYELLHIYDFKFLGGTTCASSAPWL